MGIGRSARLVESSWKGTKGNKAQLPNEMQVICLANVSQINTHLNINLYCSRKERGKQDDFFGDGWERKLQLPGSGWRWCLRGKPTQEQ